MNSRVKNFLFLLFIFLFIIITTFTWLYASGYKFNISWPIRWNRVLQKTGMLNLATLPKGAYIYLDDKAQKKSAFSVLKKDFLTTPVKIKNLLPGDYLLRLEKENYWPLEKRVKIEPGQTTFAEDINLFINDLPLLISESAPGQIIISPSNNYLFIQSTGEIFNLKTNEILDLKINPNLLGVWMKNSDKFFSNGNIIEADKNNLIDLTKNVGSSVSNWHYNNANDRIYFINQNEISRLEADYKTSTTLIRGEKYLAYEIRGDNLFVIVENNKINLKNYSLKNNSLISEIELPLMGKYELITANNKYLGVYDSANTTLYLINPSNLQDVDVIKNITDWSWLNNDEILFTNGWEISVFNLSRGESNLITRVGENINRVLYHKKGRYFIFSTQNNLNVGDFKDGSYITIFSANEIAYPALDEKNNLLYFYANTSNVQGIYKLLLQ